MEGKPTTPDYRLKFGGANLFFDVKEFDAPLPSPGFGAYDPYGPLREKINQVARQFKQYKEFSCSVVLANPNYAFVDLDSPAIVLGTMLGNLGFTVRLGVPPGRENRPVQIFTKGGKMVNDKRQIPQNTTISSIVVLGRYPLRQKRITVAVNDRVAELGRRLTWDELYTVIDACPISEADQPLKVTVYENPYARIPLTRDLFLAPFDERWGVDGEYIRRVYVGDGLGRIEKELE